MSRLLSTFGIILSLLITITSCSYSSRSNSNTTDKNLGSEISKPEGKVLFNRAATKLIDVISKNNLDTDVFSDLPTYLDRKKSQRLTNTAKILAGMNIGSTGELSQFQERGNWQQHRNFLNDAWSQLETRRLEPMRNWQQRELTTLNNLEPTIFYPFSNANFLDVYTLFPHGRVFVLVGIEPVGKIPNLERLNRQQFAQELKHIACNLHEILALDYFRPPQMINFKQEVSTALYVFLARTNNRIYDLDYISLNERAEISSPQSGKISGVKITFASEGDTKRKIIYYFSSKLSNEALAETPELVTFISKYAPQVTYLNAAAYLTHFDSFSQIRETILAQSSYLLQDDSGLPITTFESSRWNLSFYGSYTQPIAPFSDRYQSQLWQVYNSKNNIQPLNFATGYQSEAKVSNLILARLKNNFTTESPQLDLPITIDR
ncbi:hypothetical protein [Myxosarcina sp. GI1]|uniref:hypothetical protein n=1 Tax=Myxosarcina sp. GI1 TaxID=1541065 RepID=UPI00055F258A|nr:hypothetical protein [Myxosarcina sp. GI1]